MRTLICLMLLTPWTALAQEAPPPEEGAAAEPAPTPARLTFDDRVVRGSTASGAVVLTTRGQRALPSLVGPLTQLRDRTVLTLFGVGVAPLPTAASTEETP